MGLGQFPNESCTMECGAGSSRDRSVPPWVCLEPFLFIIPLKNQDAVVAAPQRFGGSPPQHPPACQAWELSQNPAGPAWSISSIPGKSFPSEPGAPFSHGSLPGRHLAVARSKQDNQEWPLQPLGIAVLGILHVQSPSGDEGEVPRACPRLRGDPSLGNLHPAPSLGPAPWGWRLQRLQELWRRALIQMQSLACWSHS